ncbi:NtaA/DmoA family FMN-dependent monooxygenase [Nocardia sp. NBC_00416]|uniref:NtaA/DmoA family FMN-dependent monooxygenase n=1 Tax=Nocardia sp. NBC_00416 TaxID=2975991 RepID=UPI002E1A566A|nr:NtaA/DmoA family FMN-dependent monooxygenase [Nocardia sp. NBC_00416]
MSGKQRELHLGLMFWATGTHTAGWRYPGARSDGAFDIGFIQEVTRLVEDAKFDFLFLGDRLATDPALAKTNPAQMSRMEPFTVASAIAAATSHIGIAVTANPTYYDPYTVARLTASLDHLSGGRAAWNLVTGADGAAAYNFSRDGHWDTEKRYDWADEFVEVVRDLWDSWEDDAFTRDKSGGRYIDESKLHTIDHVGEHFSVKGPLNVARPPQGQVVLLHAGTSDRSRELGAREADVIFAGQPDLESAREYYADVKSRAARYGRGPDEIQILPGLSVVVAPTTAAAVQVYDRLNALVPLDPEHETVDSVRFGGLGQGLKRNLASVSQVLGVDVTDRTIHDPVAQEVFDGSGDAGRKVFAGITATTRRTVAGPEPITYFDLINGITVGSRTVVGDPIEIADHIQLWFEQDAADGFNIFPDFVPGSVRAFTELVVPELQRRGLFRIDYDGTTFRDHLRLGRPGNRHRGPGPALTEPN